VFTTGTFYLGAGFARSRAGDELVQVDGVDALAAFGGLLSRWCTNPGGPPDFYGDGSVRMLQPQRLSRICACINQGCYISESV
jgi:hypothetical protein